jgi:hypothetical protein
MENNQEKQDKTLEGAPDASPEDREAIEAQRIDEIF